MGRVQLPHGEPAWLATRYADARLVFSDKRFSRAEVWHRDEPRMRPTKAIGGMLSMDPPEHTRLRTLVSKAFTVRRGRGGTAAVRRQGISLFQPAPSRHLIGASRLRHVEAIRRMGSDRHLASR
jgi:cytochrome P450